MRVLAACSLGGAGHLRPIAAVLDGARRLGHDTVVVGPPAMATMLEETGHHHEIGGEPPESAVAPVREQLPRVAPAQASVLAERDLFGRLATTAMLPRMTEVVEEFRPDLVVREPCEYASALAAFARGIPCATVAISFAQAEWGALGVAAPALEVQRAALTEELRAAPYLTRFPASLDPSPFADTRRFHLPAAAAEPLPDWWPGSKSPLLYVTFGTVLGHMSIASDVIRTVLRALRDVDARVLCTVGHQVDVAAVGAEAGDRVHVEAWVDQERALAAAAVVVCHGGSGTVFGSLAAGVPVVVVPVFADQFENGSRVARSGAGLMVADESHADRQAVRRVVDDRHAPALADAVRAVLGDDAYRRAAGHLAQEMATAPSVDDVVDTLLAGAAA